MDHQNCNKTLEYKTTFTKTYKSSSGTLKHFEHELFQVSNTQMSTENSSGPDETPQIAAFHQDLYCFRKTKSMLSNDEDDSKR